MRSIYTWSTAQLTLKPKLKPIQCLSSRQDKPKANSWKCLVWAPCQFPSQCFYSLFYFSSNKLLIAFILLLTILVLSILCNNVPLLHPVEASLCPPSHEWSAVVAAVVVTAGAAVVMTNHIWWILESCAVLKCSSSYLINTTGLGKRVFLTTFHKWVNKIQRDLVLLAMKSCGCWEGKWKWFKLRFSNVNSKQMLSSFGISKTLQVTERQRQGEIVIKRHKGLLSH